MKNGKWKIEIIENGKMEIPKQKIEIIETGKMENGKQKLMLIIENGKQKLQLMEKWKNEHRSSSQQECV